MITSKSIVRLCAALLIIVAHGCFLQIPGSAGQLLYTNSFEIPVAAEWSFRRQETLPNGQGKFLGPYAYATTTLSLSNLPPHDTLLVSYDLYIIASWDGNEPSNSGPDVFTTRLDDGRTLLRTSFSMHDLTNGTIRTQSFPGQYPADNFHYGTGAFETNSLGYPNWAITRALTTGGTMETNDLGFYFRCSNGVVRTLLFDTVYRLQHLISHTNDSIRIVFSAQSPENSLADESWGLDNVGLSIPAPGDLLAPAISRQPQGITASLGQTGTLSVTAQGTRPLEYQWRKGGQAIPGATNATFRLPPITADVTGYYDVIIANGVGTVVSETVPVIVPGLPAELAIQMHPGTLLVGSAGQTYTIQSTTDAADPNSWISITNIVLEQPRQLWIDPTPVGVPLNSKARFYRALLRP